MLSPSLNYGHGTAVGRRVRGSYSFGSVQLGGNAISQNLMSIQNPAGSGVIAAVHRAWVQGVHDTLSTVEFLYELLLISYGNPGSAQSPASLRKSDPAPVMEVKTNPAPSALQERLWRGTPGLLVTAAGQMVSECMEALNPRGEDGFVILRPGEGLMFRAEANAASWRHMTGFAWFEMLSMGA